MKLLRQLINNYERNLKEINHTFYILCQYDSNEQTEVAY